MLKFLKRFAIWLGMFRDVPNMKKKEEKEDKEQEVIDKNPLLLYNTRAIEIQ